MKHSNIARLSLIAAAALLAGSQAFAAAPTTLAVSANVNGTCKLQAIPAMVIANSGAVIDPSSATSATGTSAITYRCTKGTAPTGFTIGGAGAGSFSGSMTGAGANTLAYSLGWTTPATAGTGFGAGQDITVTVTGTITQAQFQNAPADSTYADSQTVTISP